MYSQCKAAAERQQALFGVPVVPLAGVKAQIVAGAMSAVMAAVMAGVLTGVEASSKIGCMCMLDDDEIALQTTFRVSV